MQTRKLGCSGLEVSALGLGCMGLNYHRGVTPDRGEMITLVRAAVERGVTFSTRPKSMARSPTRSSSARRSNPSRGRSSSPRSSATTRRPWIANGLDSRPERIRQVAEASLKRLRVDAIDLFYQHRVDPSVPIEDVAGTVRDLIAAGKVRHFGLSEAGTQTIRRAHAVQPIAAIQSEYSLWWRQPEEAVLPACEELGIGFVPYSPLGRGFLAGSIDETTQFVGSDNRGSLPRFAPDARRANRPIVTLLEDVGRRKGATPAQVALAWLLARKPWIVPIPGTTKLTRLEENLGAASIDLTPDDLRQIDDAASRITIQGDRYPEAVEALSGR